MTIQKDQILNVAIIFIIGQPKTIEQISYREYAVIKPYLIKEGE